MASLLMCSKAHAANNETCTITAGTLPFGNFDVYVAPSTVTAAITGTCKKGNGQAPANITFALDNGLHVQGSGNRAMTCTTCTGAFASDLLQYQIYTDATLGTIWSGATVVTIVNPCSGGCGNTPTAWGALNMYAAIFAAVPGGVNDSAIGSYSDTVTVTVNY
jgi:spore coat protein U-like protein